MYFIRRLLVELLCIMYSIRASHVVLPGCGSGIACSQELRSLSNQLSRLHQCVLQARRFLVLHGEVGKICLSCDQSAHTHTHTHTHVSPRTGATTSGSRRFGGPVGPGPGPAPRAVDDSRAVRAGARRRCICCRQSVRGCTRLQLAQSAAWNEPECRTQGQCDLGICMHVWWQDVTSPMDMRCD